MNKTMYFSPTNIFVITVYLTKAIFLDVNIKDGIQDGHQNVDFQ